MLSIYLVANTAVLVCFYFLYYPSIVDENEGLSSRGYSRFSREQEILGMMILTFLLKVRRCRSFYEVLNKFFYCAKILTLLLTYLAAPSKFHAVWLSLWYFVMTMILPDPKFGGENEVIEQTKMRILTSKDD